MYSLKKILCDDLIKEIFYFNNNYSKEEMQLFKTEHQNKLNVINREILLSKEWYIDDEFDKRGIDYFEFICDFTNIKTINKHKAMCLDFSL